MRGLTSDGIEFDVIPIGTRVQHKKYPELKGRVRTHEYCKGKYSALPYTVEWDNDQLAHEYLGFLPLWPRLEDVEPICGSSCGNYPAKTAEECTFCEERRWPLPSAALLTSSRPTAQVVSCAISKPC
jgi:hypothetical protein